MHHKVKMPCSPLLATLQNFQPLLNRALDLLDLLHAPECIGQHLREMLEAIGEFTEIELSKIVLSKALSSACRATRCTARKTLVRYTIHRERTLNR